MAGDRFRKVVVVGLDGLDPGIVSDLFTRGELPALAQLRDRGGGLSRVATTTPAQTPVAWSSFATGVNPGGHGIFDFLRRDSATYLPDMALNRYERRNAFTLPRAVNRRQGTPVWQRLAEKGVPSTILRCPCTYPPDDMTAAGWMLSGMGVPDLRGGFGSGTYYTTREGILPGEAERVEPLRSVSVETTEPAVFEGELIGPRGPRGQDLKTRFELTVNRATGEATLQCEAATPLRLSLSPGRWSDWLRVKFKAGLLSAVRGMVRLRLTEVGEAVGLYVSPVNFDPESPLFPISSPPGFAAEMADDLGLYYTIGMVEDHAGLANGRFDEAAFLDQCGEVWDEREAMLLRTLENTREGLVYCLFDTPDRVQHMFWRHTEPDHPANRGRATSAEWAGVIEEQYRRSDEVVRNVLATADKQTLVIALSDHGFGPFRRCVDLNAWLHDRGLLALRDGRRPGEEAGDMLRGIDWTRTRAYAIGLAGIYLNLEGREGQGIVSPDEAEALRQQIESELTGLSDPAHQAVAVRSVRRREAVYHGDFMTDAPDLLVDTARGWRISWTTSLGGVGTAVCSDNMNAWAGDHIVDPAEVPGILLMNQPFRQENTSLLDLAPTLLRALGVPEGSDLEGSALR